MFYSNSNGVSFYVLATLITLSVCDSVQNERSVETARQKALVGDPNLYYYRFGEGDRLPASLMGRQNQKDPFATGMDPNAVSVSSAPIASAAFDTRHIQFIPLEVYLINNKAKMQQNVGAYTKKQAIEICSMYFAQLATVPQLKTAWNAGAEWCWYGHVQEALLASPVNTKSMTDSCPGHDGKKGARVIEYLTEGLSGATCYGVKPPQNSTVRYRKEELTILPFNAQKWSQFSNARNVSK